MKDSLEEVFDTVYNGKADYGVMPVENSAEGIIGVTYHLLVGQGERPEVKICGELYHPVVLNLATIAETSLDKIAFVHTKQEPWGQCRDWVSRNLPRNVQFIAEASTSKAAELVKEKGELTRAAIVSPLAVKLYGLHLLAKGIQDVRGNATRFLIIGRKLLRRRRAIHKVTFGMVLMDRVGAITDAFGILKAQRANVRAVKIFPVRAPSIATWKDWFFVDIDSAPDFTAVNIAMSKMREEKDLILVLRELGRYPKAASDGDAIPERSSPPSLPEVGVDGGLAIEDLVAAGEGNSIEFKATLRWNRRENKKDAELEFSVVKTIAGFMNARGGVLLIGIDDKGAPLGLDEDVKTLHKQSKDGFELHVRDLLHSRFGGAVSHLINVRFEKVQDKDVCLIKVNPSPIPAWVEREGRNEFFVRSGNQTRLLDSKDAAEYVRFRWG